MTQYVAWMTSNRCSFSPFRPPLLDYSGAASGCAYVLPSVHRAHYAARLYPSWPCVASEVYSCRHHRQLPGHLPCHRLLVQQHPCLRRGLRQLEPHVQPPPEQDPEPIRGNDKARDITARTKTIWLNGNVLGVDENSNPCAHAAERAPIEYTHHIFPKRTLEREPATFDEPKRTFSEAEFELDRTAEEKIDHEQMRRKLTVLEKISPSNFALPRDAAFRRISQKHMTLNESTPQKKEPMKNSPVKNSTENFQDQRIELKSAQNLEKISAKSTRWNFREASH